jgi:hypothetical protein
MVLVFGFNQKRNIHGMYLGLSHESEYQRELVDILGSKRILGTQIK